MLLVELKRADASVAVDESTDAAPLGMYVLFFFFLDSQSFQEESGSKRDASFIATTAHYCSYLLLTGHWKGLAQLKFLVLESGWSEFVFEWPCSRGYLVSCQSNHERWVGVCGQWRAWHLKRVYLVSYVKEAKTRLRGLDCSDNVSVLRFFLIGLVWVIRNHEHVLWL